MIIKRHWSGMFLLMISGIFTYRMYSSAPWYLNINDFLIQPIIQFALPMAMLGVVLLFLPPSSRGKNILFFPVFITGIFVLLLQGHWPTPGQSTSWEDSREALFVLESAIRIFCWPAWIITIIYTFRSLRAKRQL